MVKILLTMFSMLVLISGCGNDEAQENEKDNELYQPIEYRASEKEDEGTIPYGNNRYQKRAERDEIRDSLYKETNRSHDNDFYNEESLQISEAINEIPEVTMTQAFSTDERVMIAVMIEPYKRRQNDIDDKIRAKAKEIVPDKKIVVYTNNSHWDQMKDLNARLKATKAPEDVQRKIKAFFDQFKGE
ncbi:YhcN/YlaJ family sporulation lipoprotein [Thalassobacillus sp. CUG 92003]|uniref:YhcN/YlaJ family sporulation lipoprotein n=1 Tax=Thalassobacillus sp. CUG 92003 TaxID=2736641 RepID=UPI0015E672B0|nr:YhcN/YlaJ family sporulation lipoprotein [Thalassobacillus sp. CUG 92003]